MSIKTKLKIPGMCCPVEANEIESELSKRPGIKQVHCDVMQRVVTIEHDEEKESIQKLLDQLGYSSSQVEASDAPSSLSLSKPQIVLLACSGLFAGMAEILAIVLKNETHAVVLVVALASMALSGRETLMNGIKAVVRFNLSINFLMTIAIVGAALLGSWPEAAMVCFLFTVAEMIEDLASERANRAVQKLLEVAPNQATIRSCCGEWSQVEADTVRIGDVALARAGERIVFDGVVVGGTSQVDQSPITGESKPLSRTIDDPLYAGSVNGNGNLEYRVTADSAHSTLARMIELMREAQSTRAPMQRVVDRFAKFYTPAVVGLAALIALLPPMLGYGLFHEWIYRSLVLLVISCPCALVLSTPVTIVSGLARAARMGILIKGGIHLENARQARWVALDKTGTLTHGRPTVTELVTLDGIAPDEVRQIAASLNAHSSHPNGRALYSHYAGKTLEASGVEAIPGRGIKGTVSGTSYLLGNHRLIEDHGLCGDHVEAVLEPFEQSGKTAIVLANDERALAVFAISDSIKPNSIEAIQELKAKGIRTVMLSGDNEITAKEIAHQSQVDETHAELLPEDKLRQIDRLKSGGYGLMVGDGINDAPSLASAPLGVAMGVLGTDAAIEAADVAIMDDDLRKVPTLINLSRETVAVLKQNIAIALIVKVVFFTLAFLGFATLWMAVFADMGGSLLVIANGLRLLGRNRADAVS